MNSHSKSIFPVSYKCSYEFNRLNFSCGNTNSWTINHQLIKKKKKLASCFHFLAEIYGSICLVHRYLWWERGFTVNHHMYKSIIRFLVINTLKCFRGFHMSSSPGCSHALFWCCCRAFSVTSLERLSFYQHLWLTPGIPGSDMIRAQLRPHLPRWLDVTPESKHSRALPAPSMNSSF